MPVADDHQVERHAARSVSDFFHRTEQERNVLYLGQTSDTADNGDVGFDTELPSQCFPVVISLKLLELYTKRHDGELLPPSDVKIGIDLAELLFAYDYDAVRCKSSEGTLDTAEDCGLCPPVVAVKDVTMECMHDGNTSRATNKRARREPSVKKSRRPADSTGFRRVGVNDVRAFATDQTIDPE